MRKVWVIQEKATGQFLTEHLFYSKSLARAGRLYDPQEAFDTADYNIGKGEYEVHTFYEGDPDFVEDSE